MLRLFHCSQDAHRYVLFGPCPAVRRVVQKHSADAQTEIDSLRERVRWRTRIQAFRPGLLCEVALLACRETSRPSEV